MQIKIYLISMTQSMRWNKLFNVLKDYHVAIIKWLCGMKFSNWLLSRTCFFSVPFKGVFRSYEADYTPSIALYIV